MSIGSGRRPPALGLVALLATVPGVAVSLGGLHLMPPVAALLFGISIVGAAFLLAWAAEAAQLDVSAGLAVAVLALIAVLPEYAVDFVFTARGGEAVAAHGPSCRAPGEETSACSLALANMTGANRILVGVGWALVVLIAWRRMRRRGVSQARANSVALNRADAVPIVFLALASVYCLVLPFKRTLSLADTVVLLAIFVAYSWRISRAPAGEPDLIGPSAWIGSLDKRVRRTVVIGLFVAAAAVILLTAEHFAQSLVDTGADLGINEFLLVQWLAPLASEAPELLVAGLYAWRLHTSEALGALVSSKVNQWTLLVGTLPIVFAASSGGWSGLPIESAQRDELLLTASQSLLAVSLLVGLSLSVRAALLLTGLFFLQFALSAAVPSSWRGRELIALSVVYLVLAAVVLFRRRRLILPIVRDGLFTPYRSLGDDMCCTTAAGKLRLRERVLIRSE
ncbi:cation:H+ antiporter [Asanoa ferruginea]|uniref:Cation:H+ antiporter n=1 Tax=Asanoa ferruginea TaxID=53367 RepID=A0A3D9ZE47_9ACTN|nr:sodium:proton exchanger [Asanoa ferruginea]REF95517.1 cation:H+ antiporter [Asanoa ferruginea]GIF46786.1 sodium/hydrogen exchanger [Asanoa ferruginea]